jgi:hypothetical protein
MTGRLGGPSSPPAVRLRRPGWRDPRLLLGLVLVAASVALGTSLVSAAGRTVPVWAAARPLVPGDVVAPDALRAVEVHLGPAQDAYLRADEPVPDGLVVTGTVGEGELVPRGLVATEADLGLRPVAIEPAGALPDGVRAGSRVDLWFVPAPRAGGAVGAGAVADAAAAEPRLLVAGLVVAEVGEPRSGLSVASSVTVHVLVPQTDLPAVLAARAADGDLEVVLVPGGDA